MPRMRWTPEEEERLVDLIAAGKSWTSISGILKRSMKSIEVHAKTLRVVGAKRTRAKGNENNVELSLPGAQNSVMTAIIYFSEMLVASLLAILLLAISHIRMNLDAVLFLGGVVGWTLAEYFVHRFVLHGLAPIQHGLHHANPDEAVLTISWQIWVCFLLTYLVAGGTFVAGALIAYAWYLFVHHCSHHSPDSLSLTLIGHHRNHHRFATRNFGVSTTFWDHIFGTTLDGVPAKK